MILAVLALIFGGDRLRKSRLKKARLESPPKYGYTSESEDDDNLNQSQHSTALSDDDGSVNSDLSLASQQKHEEEVREHLESHNEKLVDPSFKEQTHFKILGKVGGKKFIVERSRCINFLLTWYVVSCLPLLALACPSVQCLDLLRVTASGV